MTELLYYDDAYLKSFEARVANVVETQVALDRTAFYPGGGGQPFDTGQLSFGGQTVQVVRTKKADGEVWHELGGPLPAVGEVVQGLIDWDRRYQLMRTHTAMHVLCGVVWVDYGASVTGGNMEPLHGRMDFEFERMQKELVADIERRINEEASRAHDVEARILPRKQPFRSRISSAPRSICFLKGSRRFA